MSMVFQGVIQPADHNWKGCLALVRQLYLHQYICMIRHLSRILDTLHVALSTHVMYHYLIELFGNFVAIYDIVW